MIPDAENFDESFKVDHFIRLELHDKDPKGSLLGFSFNKEKSEK